jgi:uncharacterized membrane protein
MDDSRRSLDFASAAGITVLLAIGVWAHATLPPQIPTHFDLAGRPSGWGPSWTILTLPATVVIVAGIIWIVAALGIKPNLPFQVPENRRDRVNALSRQMTSVILFLVVLFMIPLELEIVAGAHNAAFSLLMIPTVVVLLISTLSCGGLYMMKMYRATR